MRIAINGCTGKIGKELIKIILDDENHEIAAAITHKNNPSIGKDAASLVCKLDIGVLVNQSISDVNNIDVIIDFSMPEASMKMAKFAANYSIPYVIGTTGFSDEQLNNLEQLSKSTKIFISANMSFGINILLNLLNNVSNLMNNGFDIDIIEAHHKHKTDSPSGTALMLGKQIAKGLDLDFDDAKFIYEENKNSKRPPSKIGFSSIRSGGIIGQHKISFANDDEIIELSHQAINRSIFAKNAIRVAEWLIKQPPGVYNMNDMLKI